MGFQKFSSNVSEIINNGQKVKVDISKVYVPEYHDRTDVDDESIESLANNMSEMGQISPILVEKKSDDDFDLISGLRRLSAAQKLNWSAIDAIIFEALDDQSRLLIMISENAQRSDLNDYDLVVSLVHLLSVSTGKTDDEIKTFINKLRNLDSGNVKNLSFDEKQLKKVIETTLARTDKYSISNLSNKIRVLDYHPDIIKAMQDRKLTFNFARMLNKIKDEQVLKSILFKYLTQQITKDELKKEIRKATAVDNSNVIPFTGTLKKLKDFNKLPEDKQKKVTDIMKEIDTLLAS